MPKLMTGSQSLYHLFHTTSLAVHTMKNRNVVVLKVIKNKRIRLTNWAEEDQKREP